MHTAYFVADLHLLTRRSRAERYRSAMVELASGASLFVLGGDIFDFPWAEQPTIEAAVRQAVDWLRGLVSECPGCRFYYVLGNHDCRREFVRELEQLCGRTANLEWTPFYVRMGPNLFLHGDLRGRRCMAAMLASRRARWTNARQRSRARGRLYDLAGATRLHTLVAAAANPRRRIARRILRYLDEIGQGPAAGVRHVYFGHTHRPLADYQYGGLTFHNSGTPMRGVRFRIVPVETLDLSFSPSGRGLG